MLAIENTTRSYTGRPGCMCGCNGKYSEAQRNRKLALTKMIKEKANLLVWNSGNEGCLYVDTNRRSRVLYLNAAGVQQARLMKIFKEDE